MDYTKAGSTILLGPLTATSSRADLIDNGLGVWIATN